MRTVSLIAVLALSGFVGACSLIPDYERPAAPVPAQYPLADTVSAAATVPTWQEFFRAPDLRRRSRRHWKTTATCVWPC